MQFTTAAEFAAWADDTTVSERTVERANDQVSHALRYAVYEPDAQGRPRYALEELRRVANVQILALQKADTEEAPLASASIGGASYTYDLSRTEDLLRLPSGGGLCQWAQELLLDAPFIGWGVVTNV